MLIRNVAHSTFEICRSFERFVGNVALIDQEWLKLRVAALCRWKESIQQLLMTTISTSLVVKTTSRNRLKDFSQRTPRYQTAGPWKSTASGLRHVGNIWMSWILRKWACWLTTETRCVKNCVILWWKSERLTNPVSTAEHPANSVLTAAIHQTGEATNAS